MVRSHLSTTPLQKVRGRQPFPVWVSGAIDHDADRGEDDHGFGHLGKVLVIFGQALPTAKPAECAFDHPPPRQRDEALDARGAADASSVRPSRKHASRAAMRL